MTQAALGGRSLELSTSAEHDDHTMQGAQLESVDVDTQGTMRPSSRSRAVASPRVRSGLPQMARSKRPKSMPLSRGLSPRPPRSPLPGHEMVTACRAGGDQDVEARLRVLEQQREDDHRHFLEIRDHFLKLGPQLDRKEAGSYTPPTRPTHHPL